MRLRVGQVDGVRLAGDQADEAFVGAQHGLVDGFALEAFGGVEFERAVDAQHVARADFRHHVGGDQHHNLVEAFLRADRFRHDLAEPAQQHARTAEGASHGESPWGRISKAGLTRCPAQLLVLRKVRTEPAHATALKAIANAAGQPQGN